MFPAETPPKRLSQNQINGQRGELLVADRTLAMGFAFHALNRLEAGVDGVMELRDPATQAMLGRWIGVQVKTTANAAYTREDGTSFEYLLDPADLAYWRQANIPLIIVLVRLSDSTMYWADIGSARFDEPRRLRISKTQDAFSISAADRVASLTVEKDRLGSYVPPMLGGELGHLNLVRMILPEEIFVARTSFKSTREATKEMLRNPGRPFFDWIVRDGSLWSFRDPRTGPMAEVVDVDTVEAVEVKLVSLPDNPDDENAVIDLLRRSVEAQLYDQLVFDKDSRSLYFRAEAAGKARTYIYRSLQQATSAEVVKLIKKQGREDIMRHHAFNPRYQRLGDNWFISIQPTFVFTADGHRPHPASSLMLSGKKKLEKEGAVRGQIIMWRHLLIESGKPSSGLFDDPDRDARARIQFEALEPVALPISVPEDVWKKDDPNAANMVAPEGLL